jgi:hypothetical protein
MAAWEGITTAHEPFEKCWLDIGGPLTKTRKGNKCILTFQDVLSTFLVACPIQQQDAETIAKEFVTHIILKMSTPKTVLTDQGTNFMSEIFKNVWKMLKINYSPLLSTLKAIVVALNVVTEY